MLSPLVTSVAHIISGALPELSSLEENAVGELLTVPKPDLGDFAFPCFPLAKTLRRAPQAIAAQLAQALTAASVGPDSLLREATATGPYVNLRIHLPAAAQLVLPPWATGDTPHYPDANAKVMVEYSQPNTHKAFHVGHMRNLCLGDSLVRVLRATGHEVVAANYLGDVGAHIAKCLWFYLDHLDEAQRKPPARARGEWLGRIYSDATKLIATWETAIKEDADTEAQGKLDAARLRMSEILRNVESREPEMTRVWQDTRQWSLDEFDEIYAWSGVVFDRLFYESEVDKPGLALVETYLKKGIFVESEGTIGLYNDEIKHMPYFMLRKGDGTGLYATKDLALAKLKFEEYGIDRSIYVVDVRQSDHFRHVFLTLAKMGFPQADRCEHVPYAFVDLPSGPISTRTGNVILFSELQARLRTTLEDDYFAKYKQEWSSDEINRAAHQVALGAIKYGMLARDVNQRIVFQMEDWLKFEGNTGPYLQYVAARISSILRKAHARGKSLDFAGDPSAARSACAALREPSERALVLALDRLPGVVAQVSATLRPSHLCTFLFDLAKIYNRFQRDCNVITSEGPTLEARLLLITATRSALAWGLGLLGITAPERM